MLSPRELSSQHLPSRIWINEHLTFTHGYGIVVGPVNRITPEGLPEFFVINIDGQAYPIVWSILGAAVTAGIFSLLFGRSRRVYRT